MNDEIFMIISKYVPFSFYEIKMAHGVLRSFDAVFAALNYSAIYGTSIVEAVNNILRNEIELPPERIDKLYA